MFKFVVLCAFVAAAAADPEPAVYAALPYSAPAVVPAPAVYSSPYTYSPSVVSAAPLAYTSAYGYPHFIKKRSLAVSPYIAPSTYVAPTPYVNSWAGAYATPYTTYAGPLAATYPYSPVAHLIKKRAAPFVVPSTYVASSPYVAPYVASTYAAHTPVVSSPYFSTAPLAYSHFIKKRSVAPLAVAAYTAPTAYSHQSRFDYTATSPLVSTYSTYTSPLVYPSPLAHVY